MSTATRRDGERRALPPWLVLAVGIGAFAVGRLLSGGIPPVEWALRAVALATLAAVAEEAFYRRLAYGVARPPGPSWPSGRRRSSSPSST